MQDDSQANTVDKVLLQLPALVKQANIWFHYMYSGEKRHTS